MTTSVHIVNFGPNAVKVNPSGQILYSQQSHNEYVYEGHSVTVEEVLPTKETTVE